MSLSLRQIRYFIAAAEFGQVSLAAIHLHISQSAVTTAIQELESLLGTNLFTRSVQGVTLTDMGRVFLGHAYTILQDVDEALNIPRFNNVQGTLRLATSYTVMGYFLPFHLQKLNQLYPQLEIKLVEKEREEIEEGLLNDEFDIALILTSNIKNPDIALETIFKSQRRLWLPQKHPFKDKPNIALIDIIHEPYILLTVDEADTSALDYWNSIGFQPNVILKTNSLEAVRSMVANGLGITILSNLVYRPWSLEGKKIELLTLTQTIPAMAVGFAWNKSKELNHVAQVFRSYFQEQAKTMPFPL